MGFGLSTRTSTSSRRMKRPSKPTPSKPTPPQRQSPLRGVPATPPRYQVDAQAPAAPPTNFSSQPAFFRNTFLPSENPV
ncbi:hypothetical protein SV7mr_23450 [Stieleria bergensis]|uniref:Uncharacterized protein n=1 Tax=Stieleria bergensis TaxID=2528025 RepID=A0A517SUQ2_9BACT|nr:hypothetical protein SV7mr_23450 [Planctomycetes bacterium SV_7m_r]